MLHPSNSEKVCDLLDRMQAVYEAKDSDYNENDLDAGHWLINVLETCANQQSNGHYAAKMYGQAMQLLEVVDCEVVVSDGV